MSKLAKKVALVTGGSRGIGAAIAKRLAADGASVAITYAKDASAASAVVKAIELGGGKAIAIQADAADVEAVKGAVEKVVSTFGRLDVLVNNAGTAIPKPFEESTLEEMDRVLDINVRGVFATTQAALKHMKDGGRIIMVGSAVGERAVAPGLVPYAATKGAVKMFTQALSKEVGSRGITVNNVQPGPIDTNLNPASGDWAVPQKAATALDRYGHVDEIAAMVAFVAVPESSYITHEGGAFQANDETLPVTEYAIRKLSTYNLSHLLLMGNTTDFSGTPLEKPGQSKSHLRGEIRDRNTALTSSTPSGIRRRSSFRTAINSL
jgi:3-oxoacyl-[acyl-carrier protein] reductase